MFKLFVALHCKKNVSVQNSIKEMVSSRKPYQFQDNAQIPIVSNGYTFLLLDDLSLFL